MDDDELLRQNGIDPATLSEQDKASAAGMIRMLNAGGGTGPTTDPAEVVAQAIQGTIFDMGGRQGLTGRSLQNPLPIWAADIAEASPGIFDNTALLDPYLGTPNEGDEMVYMGERKARATRAATEKERKARLGAIPAKETLSQGVDDKGNPTGGVVTQNYELPAAAKKDPQAWWNTEPTKAEREALENPLSALPTLPGIMPTPGAGGHGYSPLELAAIRLKVERWDAANPPEGEGDEAIDIYSNEGDRVRSATQVLNLPYTWSDEKIAEVMKLMRESGLNVTTFDQMTANWAGLVERASMIYGMSEGERKVTPWDVLDMVKSEAQAAGLFTNYESGTKVSTHRSIAQVTEGEAWTTMQQTVANMLGRDPSDQEVRDFTYRMNQLAARNPEISKTITKYKGGEAVSSTTRTTEAGFSGADMAMEAYEDAQGDPEYGAYQASSTYFNAALSALGAIGQT